MNIVERLRKASEIQWQISPAMTRRENMEGEAAALIERMAELLQEVAALRLTAMPAGAAAPLVFRARDILKELEG